MSWSKTHDLCIRTGVFRGADGQEKFRFKSVGKVMSDGKGKEILVVDRHFCAAGAYPDGKEGVTLFKFEDKLSSNQRFPNPPQPQTQEEMDDIPF